MRRVLCAALALGVAGCIFPSEPIERLELSITISADRVVADSGLGIRLVAVNATGETLRIEHLMGCLLNYDLVPPPGAELPSPAGFGCVSIADETEVAPGDSVVLAQGQGFRPSRTGWWVPGRYQVIGYLMDLDGNRVHETAPVEFELVCRDPTWDKC